MKENHSEIQLVDKMQPERGFLETMLGLWSGKELSIPLFHRHMERMTRTLFPGSAPEPGLLLRTITRQCRQGEILQGEILRGEIHGGSPRRLRIRLQYAPAVQEASPNKREEDPDTIHLDIQIREFQPGKIRRAAAVELPDAEYSSKVADRRLFSELHRQYPGFDEIIITRNGYLSDGTFTNLILCPPTLPAHHHPCLTPSTPLLEGCRRRELMAQGLLITRPLHLRRLPHGWRLGFINALNPPGQLGWVLPETLHVCG
ncbi:hypothetical protein [Salinispira pacifica]|uniref:Aminodeoxychorismate lyase n=1 Tax=Salinispira pacifica TaxID=1307761 RepID=V5WEJ3_9SPIO|nr:hypothetical protein [Salinispira pacifica]AHC14233.1 hypothetical protein L21SP2_0811 [Salinispira pacifica]